MTAHPAGLAVVAALAVSSAPALAAAPATDVLVVRVASPACATVPAFNAFLDTLRVELAAHGPRCCAVEAQGAPPVPGAATLALEPCNPTLGETHVSLDNPAHGGTVEREISLPDVPATARPRALALAVAELLRSAGQVTQPPVVAAATNESTRPVVRGTAGSHVTAAVSAGAELRLYPKLHTTLWGGRLALSLLGDRWQGELDLDAAAGDRQVNLGTVHVLALGGGLAVGPRFDLGPAALDLDLCGDIGWARIAGQTAEPGVGTGAGSGLVATVGARIGMEAPAGRSIRLGALIQAGAAARGLTGNVDGVPAAGISGAYILVVVGVGLYRSTP